MGFIRDEVGALLVQVHRRCCICHRYCGVKIETDHIVPRDEGGGDEIENAIPVCFGCHAEIHSYNDRHPRGRKFQPNELRAHKAQWIQTCADHPEMLIASARAADVGPLQALIDELEFNKTVCEYQAAPFADKQFRRAIRDGAIATLDPALRQDILHAYAAMGQANNRMAAEANQDAGTRGSGLAFQDTTAAIELASQRICAALDRLIKFLSSEQ
jgi:hypothetical protein